MGKITFRADDDLVDELETFDVSKSEVLREALRSYLQEPASDAGGPAGSDSGGPPRCDSGESVASESETRSVDDVLTERIDEALDERLSRDTSNSTDVNLRITVDPAANGGVSAEPAAGDDGWAQGAGANISAEYDDRESSGSATGGSCGQCGMEIDASHVYCPNCGEKATHRVFCECGEEVRSDWAFCPACGRRTPAADVLDSR
ncbi:double zinc ribbon domain-containing protein [Halovivax limisalsi]|uniref:double zinc ribbon domain-containing protein n=1 Tax=Halovivax limisalsi TaxID=1453760 RepID=UPI001FFD9AD7|nr:zinc ribbon domain-containing protein [Halovivax limisalsi]